MSQPTVLVVDPNPAIRRRVDEALEGSRYRVIQARDPAEANRAVDGQDLALVLAAASLPRGNGYDLARNLRDRCPAAAIMLMTGGFEVYNKSRASEAGVTGHLTKPFTATALRDVVADVLGPLSTGPLSDEPDTAPLPVPNRPPSMPSAASRTTPPLSAERVATLLPRTYEDVPMVAVDPAVVAPAMERAILDVLPEVVEAVLRQALTSSPAFRELVSAAVEEAVRAQLPAIAHDVVSARITAIEDAADRR